MLRQLEMTIPLGRPKYRTLMALLAAPLIGCAEPSAPPSPSGPTYGTRFVLVNNSDSAELMGYLAVVESSTGSSVERTAGVWVQPIGVSEFRERSGPRCEVGCVITMRVDLIWPRRSFRLQHIVQAPGDTVVRFEWPSDTLRAVEQPFPVGEPYCLSTERCGTALIKDDTPTSRPENHVAAR